MTTGLDDWSVGVLVVLVVLVVLGTLRELEAWLEGHQRAMNEAIRPTSENQADL